jgi:ABC-type glutathione transport system ATPase component
MDNEQPLQARVRAWFARVRAARVRAASCAVQAASSLLQVSPAALTQALKNFKGAVITVSHNQAFVAEIANEKWIVEDGKITCVQLRDAKAR